MKLDSKLSSLTFKSDKYTVFHVRENDYKTDLSLLVSNPDKSYCLLIPTDTNVLKENIPYFASMLSEDSNWEESKIKIQVDDDISKSAPILEITVPEPCYFALYLKAVYDKNLVLTKNNCAGFLQIIDFLSVESCLKDVENFVKENLTFENT